MMRERSGCLCLTVSVLVFIMLTLLAAPVVGAQGGTEEEPLLPDPGLLPGSPFYFVKQLLERVRLALARSSEERLVLMAHLLEVRLAEAKALAERDEEALVARTMERYRDLAERAALEVERASAQGRDITGALLALERATRRGREVCLRVMERIREGLVPGRLEIIDQVLSRFREMLPGPGRRPGETQGHDEGQSGGS
ncbi:MAG TPA: hypothetical protein DGR79_00820 [Clostridiales bacterium]|nr:hypothetical protein [Clostridiales bacterium]